MIQEIDTVVIGAGHAGLCMSYVLQQEGREHVVLEKARPLEQWRSARWDSFMMNTPLAYSRLIGQKDGLPGEKMSISLSENIGLWDAHIDECKFPVRQQTEVVSVERAADGDLIVEVKSSDGDTSRYKARNVVAAPGNYQVARIPGCARNLRAEIQQLTVGTYTNPDALADGAVLVVGGGQSGMQIAEELLQAGRRVFIATSKVKGSPRSYRGEDIFFWMDRIGLLTLPHQALPDSSMKYDRVPIVGNDHAISHHSLARMGASFLGRLNGISPDGGSATFDDKLQEYIAFAQEGYDFLVSMIEDWIANQGNAIDYPPPTPEPEWIPHDPLLQYVAPATLDLGKNNVRSVLWCTGWGADLAWLKMPAVQEELGPHGRPESCETQVAGFFWLGFHWLRFLNSANVAGFHHDAPYIASRLR